MTHRRRRTERDEQNPVGLSGWLYTDLLLGLMVVFLATVSVMNLTDDENDNGSGGASASTTTTTTTTTTPEADELLDQVEALTEQLTKAETENQALSDQGEDLGSHLAKAEGEIDNLEAEKSQLQSTLSDLIRHLDSAIDELSRAQIPLGVEQGYICFRINERIEVVPHPNLEETWLPAPESDSVDLLVNRLNEELAKAGLESRYAGIVLTFSVSTDSEKWRALRDAKAFNDLVLTRIPMFEKTATRAYHDGIPRSGVKYETSGGDVFDKVDGGFMLEIHLLDDGKGAPPLGVDDNPKNCG